jgi:hypothetical protein
VGAAASATNHSITVGRRVVGGGKLVLDMVMKGRTLLVQVLKVLVVESHKVVVSTRHHGVVGVVAIGWRRNLRRLQVLEVRQVRRWPKVEGAWAFQF